MSPTKADAASGLDAAVFNTIDDDAADEVWPVGDDDEPRPTGSYERGHDRGDGGGSGGGARSGHLYVVDAYWAAPELLPPAEWATVAARFRLPLPVCVRLSRLPECARPVAAARAALGLGLDGRGGSGGWGSDARGRPLAPPKPLL